MKVLLSFLAIFMLNKECDQKKMTDASNEATTISENALKMIQDDTTISYETSTRGFYEKIWVESDSITVTSDRNHEIIRHYATPKEDWNELMALLKDLNIDEMSDLEAPTSKSLYDGAAIATLAVTQGKQETKSNSFDHGYPPQAIEAIVNKVISMKETYEKN